MSKRGKDAGFMKKKKMARLRFRGIVHMVMFNKFWLQDVEEQKISTNVKKNIAMLVRQQKKIGILTMAEKALIRTPAWSRSVEDRKKLLLLVLNLTCFASYPPKIRARLASVIKFNYVNSGRYIIREGGAPLGVYFILTGEVEVLREVHDYQTNKRVEKLEFICGPGDVIGDVEMLERCRRQHSCKTTNDVELLTVLDDDFNKILRSYMEKQWGQKKRALAAFDYFSNWSTAQANTVCKIGQLKQYEPLETIYHEDKGPLSYVHFVISGQCMILQCLKLKVTEKKGKKLFTLLDITEDESALLFSNLTKEEMLKKLSESRAGSKPPEPEEESQHSSETEENEEVEEEVAGVYRKARKSDYKKYAQLCGVTLSAPQERKGSLPILEEAINRLSTITEQSEKERHSSLLERLDIKEKENFRFENHFIDVGSLTFGGIFGLGEHLDNRVIMARTTVQCLLIPRFWLLEKDQNPGRIWQRMRFYLDTTIPSREILFQDFLATRKWQSFKKQVVQQSLDDTKVGNPTKMEDIPIICRIVEAQEDDES